MRFCFRLGVAILLAWCGIRSASAQVGSWHSYTSMREVTALSSSGDAVWVGTAGGIYRQVKASGEIKRYTNVEGLHASDVAALTFDPGCGAAGCVWIGYGDGVIDRLDVETDAIKTFRDLQRADRYTSRSINRFAVTGDSLLIATAFGLVVFDKSRSEIRDTYDQIGSAPLATPVHDAIMAAGPDGSPALWLATEEGVGYAYLSAPNLKDPSAWTVETSGLPSPRVLSLVEFHDSLYVGTALGLARREAAGTYAVRPVTTWPVLTLESTPQGLLGLDQFSVLVANEVGAFSRLLLPGVERPTDVVLSGDTVWVGDRGLGLVPARLDTDGSPKLTALLDCQVAPSPCYPEGPYFGVFADLDVDAAGNLWAAGTSQPGSGFHRLDLDGNWTDFTGAATSALIGRNAFTRVYAGPDGTLWAASEGSGLAQVSPGGDVTVYTQANSTLRAPEGERNADFINVGGAAEDLNNYLWVTDLGASRPLHVRAPDGTWTALSFPSGCGLTSSSATLRDIFVDSFGEKWITVFDKQNFRHTIGLLVLDTKNTPTDQADDACRFFRQGAERGQGLPSDTVKAVGESTDGLIWVATDRGLAYTVNTGAVAGDPNAAFSWPLHADRAQGTYVLQGLGINDISTDPANRIWAATAGNGVWLLEEQQGAYQVKAHFDTQNSPLPSDDVLAVAVNQTTGEVFFATPEGMIGYKGDAIQAADERRDLLVYPNPVRVSDGGEMAVYIDGLVEATEVIILAADGTLVSRFATRGGRAVWDGKDTDQRAVPPGIYLVVAVGRDGEGAAYGKVALIR